MKKLILAGVVLVISASANAAIGLPEFPASILPDFLVPSVRGGDYGRRDYYDERHDRGRHRGHYKKRYPRRDRVETVPVPVPPTPYVPAPPMPPRPPRPPGF